LAAQAVLVTNNVRPFERVAGLNIENWMDGQQLSGMALG
jgi:predicted nucleic acid-binding protein